ncbi:CRISPR-associated helicase/endonuclease Cas3 [Sulfobacillus thermosulfidooxidans]|uniref:CRISPR-associated helicase/endonuclease Cas3 n=1 Tax=Sulfobacillus thermosulfidooxidans TaxID=28034 RepID=UPI0006B5ABCD|nr:CRISPR-associated helicase/endonuclease Cas3 [Sulfobacillus thermosulfidooxidans]
MLFFQKVQDSPQYWAHSPEYDAQGHGHPADPLIVHLIQVAHDVAHLAQTLSPHLVAAAWIAGACHDFGKYTPAFQDYIHNTRQASDATQHALLSAFWGAYQALANHLPDPWPYAIFTVIRRHHGNLHNPEEDLHHLAHSTLLPTLAAQIAGISQSWPTIAPETQQCLSEAARWHLTWDNDWPKFAQLWQHPTQSPLMKTLRRQSYQLSTDNHLAWPDVFRLFAILLDTDKRVSSRERLPDPQPLPSYAQWQTAHTALIASHQNDRLAPFRQTVRETVLTRLRQHPDHPLYTLTAPTGSGKTLTALEAALILREHLQWQGPIIYAVPFVTLTEDITAQLQRWLQTCYHPNDNAHFDPTPWILRDDYLAPSSRHNTPNDHETLTVERYHQWLPRWHSPIIVTTFVKLMQTLMSPQNRGIRRLVRLHQAIIIADEVQSLPAEHWPIFRQSFITWSQTLPARFLLMSATQPHIFSDTDTQKPYELFGQPLPSTVPARTHMIYHDTPWTPDDLAQQALQDLNRYPHTLIIVNTLSASAQVFQALTQRLAAQSPRNVTVRYLSTLIPPQIRRARLRDIKAHLQTPHPDQHPLIVVATQVIEAGVDVSFHRVFRELAPWDALIQAAGRCQRHGQTTDTPPGPVHVMPLIINQRHHWGAIIYGPVAMAATQNILQHHQGPWTEKEYPQLLDQYYRYLAINGTQSADNWQEAMRSWHFDYLNTLQIIQESPSHYRVPLFVAWNTEADHVWQQWQTQHHAPDFWQWIVNIPFAHHKTLGAQYIDPILPLYYLSPECTRPTYTQELGLAQVLLDQGETIIW